MWILNICVCLISVHYSLYITHVSVFVYGPRILCKVSGSWYLIINLVPNILWVFETFVYSIEMCVPAAGHEGVGVSWPLLCM